MDESTLHTIVADIEEEIAYLRMRYDFSNFVIVLNPKVNYYLINSGDWLRYSYGKDRKREKSFVGFPVIVADQRENYLVLVRIKRG